MAPEFDFLKRLGSGYFGEVWLARDTGLDALRAVKLIPPDRVPNPTNFFHEAQLLKAAEHANVVRVEETGKMADGRLYVAMEYLEKGSLEDEAAGAYVDLTRARRIMIDVLRGLQHAHHAGILHRDIKPANILVGDSSEGKLSDFGLALPTGVDPRALGIKDYLYVVHTPPEVARRRPYTVEGEIYACGVTLYRLVNGDSYVSPPKGDLRRAITRGDFPDRTRYREFVPRSLKTLINRAMKMDPADRFESPEAMRRSLERLKLEMNWQEALLPNGRRWITSWDKRVYEVVRRRISRTRWSVSVRRGPTKASLRRVGKLCLQDASRAKAEAHTRKILQDFVLGRR